MVGKRGRWRRGGDREAERGVRCGGGVGVGRERCRREV
jgi:hypothetical protein